MEALGLFLISIGAGAFGAMLGLGGGIILVPALTLLFHQDIKHAVAISLVGVVATSCVGVQTFLRKGLVDLPLALWLLIPTVSGAIVGGWLGTLVAPKIIAGLFIILILYITFHLLFVQRHGVQEGEDCKRDTPTHLHLVGYLLSFFAGIASALLGVGGGILQVPMLHLLMGTPFRCAIATSNYLIGATGTTSALLYLAKGYLQPDIVVPCALGVMVGARFGAWIGLRARLRFMRPFFALVMVYTAYRMIEKWFL